MSQQQPKRQDQDQDPIKYGDVFDVSDEKLATEPIAPLDAGAVPSAENSAVGERSISVSDDDNVAAGYRVVIEAIGGDVVGQYIFPPTEMTSATPAVGEVSEEITIGEALEATAISAGDKPVDQSDAAAIQAAEVRATGLGEVMPGGIGAEAQHAAAVNSRTADDGSKTTLADVLTDASSKLVHDKPVTAEDAAGVVTAEARNKEGHVTHPHGVAASMTAAAGLNQENAFNITI